MSFFVSCPITNAQADPHLLRAWSKKRHTCMLPDFMQALLCLIARQIPQLIELPRFIVQGFYPDFIGIDITEKEKR